MVSPEGCFSLMAGNERGDLLLPYALKGITRVFHFGTLFLGEGEYPISAGQEGETVRVILR